MKRGLILAVAVVLCGAAYARWVEPTWLQTTRLELDEAHARHAGAGLRIAQISDFHIREVGDHERGVIAAVQKESPDLILITGDLTENPDNIASVASLLSGLRAPKGVYVTLGNWEHWIMARPELRLRAAGLNVLLNQNVDLGNGIWLAALDDAFAGAPSMDAAFKGIPEDAFVVVALHSPGYFAEVADRADLVLAGHTHGGQVRLPLVGALWLPPASGSFESGWYRSSRAQMFVSRGLGTSILPIRFFCRPELVVLDVGARAGATTSGSATSDGRHDE